jgi:hypothetical protein
MPDAFQIQTLLDRLRNLAEEVAHFGWHESPGWPDHPRWDRLHKLRQERNLAASEAARKAVEEAAQNELARVKREWNAGTQASLLADFARVCMGLGVPDPAAALSGRLGCVGGGIGVELEVAAIFRLAQEGNLPGLVEKLESFCRPETSKAPGLFAAAVRRAGAVLSDEAARRGREWLSRVPGAPPVVSGGMQGRAALRKPRNKATVSARITDRLQREPESVQWTLHQWADHLGCAESTVAETAAWKTIMKARIMAEVERKDRDRGRRRK